MDDKRLDELLNGNIDDILNAVKEDIQEQLPGQAVPVAAQQPEQEKRKPNQWRMAVLTYLHDLVSLLAGVVLIFLLLFRVVVVSGTSMNNTLYDGDYLLLLSSTFYQAPQRGDVIVASKESFDNGAPIVKRVIATEGQVVNIDFANGIVYVDGVALEESYITTPTKTPEGVTFPLTVDEGCLFVLGDNRGVSKDSRHPEIGQIDKREVLGKVFFLFYPGTNHNTEPLDFGRIGVVN